ncbi:hypothetical protein LZ32DRAFT_600409 [Colletotrichum eremochloae]|nr:hypothetical protein LZ32DRAFT_600409 [Colletotrichum eremochloae]
MRVSMLGLCICCVSGATLVTALPSSQGATFDKREEPKPNIIQREDATPPASAPAPAGTNPPPNANVPPFESAVLVDGVASLSTRDTSAKEVSGLQERQLEAAAVFVAVVGIPALLTLLAFDIASDAIQNVLDFNQARKIFTSTQTEEMWKRNPDYNKFPATACYSLGYRLANPNGFTQLANITVKAGDDQVVYDCMFVEAPNQFFTNGDGGSLNLGVVYDPKRCSFDHKTADLTCN